MIDNALLEIYNQNRETSNTDLICHAPFVSLNFEQNGNVTACCYNRSFVLGKYPLNTLQQIWTGEKANELRAYIKDKDLSHGCELCLHQLESHNFSGMRARGYDAYAHDNNTTFNSSQHQPKVLEFELSNTCNLECIMCNGHFSSSIRKNREKLPLKKNPYDADFINQLEAFMPDLEVAKFLGGEPFLIDMYYDIWDKMIAINPNIRLQITTNGTILNNKVKDTLEILQSDLIISIDSVVKETYEIIRKNANFERVMDHLEYFIDYCQRHNTQLSFAVCPIRQNWEEMPELIKYCNNRNIKVFFNTVLNPLEHSLTSYNAAELSKIEVYYKTPNLPANTAIEQNNKEAFTGLLKQVGQWNEVALQIPSTTSGLYEDALKIIINDYHVLDNQQLILPELLQYIIGIYALDRRIKPKIPLNDKYYNFYNQSLKMFSDKVFELLNHLPITQRIQFYLTALEIFHLAALVGERKDGIIGKYKKLKESLDLVPSKEAMYNEITKASPVRIVESIADIDENQITSMLVEHYSNSV